MPGPASDFIAFNARWRVGLMVLVSLGFIGAGLWMGGVFGPPPSTPRYPAGEAVVIGWTIVPLFGLFGLLWVKRLFGPADQLTIGPAGIRWRAWSDSVIPWSEISDVTTWTFRRQRSIVLHLRNSGLYPGRGAMGPLAGASKGMTGGDISISLTGTDRSFDEAMAAIARFRGHGSTVRRDLKAQSLQ